MNNNNTNYITLQSTVFIGYLPGTPGEESSRRAAAGRSGKWFCELCSEAQPQGRHLTLGQCAGCRTQGGSLSLPPAEWAVRHVVDTHTETDRAVLPLHSTYTINNYVQHSGWDGLIINNWACKHFLLILELVYRGPLSVRWTLELFQRQCWGKFWERVWSA